MDLFERGHRNGRETRTKGTVCPAIRLTIRYCLDKQICNLVFCYTMGTHSDECNHKTTNPDPEVRCLSCHLDMNRKIPIRCSYREVKVTRERDENFIALRTRLRKKVSAATIEKFQSDNNEYHIILFNDGKTLKEVIKSENCGFFGDRPAMYFFRYDGEKPYYVGETRNSFQRLSYHRGKKEILNGGIVINTTRKRMWPEDPLNQTNVRLVLERMLKHLVYTHTNNTNPGIDKWVTCTEKEAEKARKLAKGIYRCAKRSKSPYWSKLVNTEEEWSPDKVPAWY